MKGKRITNILDENFATTPVPVSMDAIYDSYSLTSGHHPKKRDTGDVRLPHDGLSDKELEALNGEIRVYKEGINNEG